MLLRNKNGILIISIGVNILVTYLIYINEILNLPKCITFMICSVATKTTKTTVEEAFNELCYKDKLLDSPCLYLIRKDFLLNLT